MVAIAGGWGPAPAPLPALGAAVHVWAVDLDLPTAQLVALAATLAPDEQARAARFHFARDRDHYIAARGTLRAILASYLGCAPAVPAFAYGPQGKPALAAPFAAGPRFSLTHSGALALLAMSAVRDLGVDLEYHRLVPNALDIARHFFTSREAAALAALPPARQQAGFFHCWTQKEAYLKAHGGGLSVSLDAVEVVVDPAQPPRILTLGGDPQAAARWTLRSLAPAPDYSAVLAIAGPLAACLCWRWA